MMWERVIHFPYLVSNTGEVKHVKTGRRLRPRLTKKGYHRVILCLDNLRKDFFVHRLVASLFVDNPLNLPVVNHKDGNKTNNTFSNLEWCTVGYNQLHAYKTGLRKKSIGVNHWRSKLKQKQIS